MATVCRVNWSQRFRQWLLNIDELTDIVDDKIVDTVSAGQACTVPFVWFSMDNQTFSDVLSPTGCCPEPEEIEYIVELIGEATELGLLQDVAGAIRQTAQCTQMEPLPKCKDEDRDVTIHVMTPQSVTDNYVSFAERYLEGEFVDIVLRIALIPLNC